MSSPLLIGFSSTLWRCLAASFLARGRTGQHGGHERGTAIHGEEKELILHPDRHGLRMVLGELEADIMEIIWQQPAGGWCTVRDVYETMRANRRIAYTTVMNTMARLAKKGVLDATRHDLAYHYRPRQSRADFIQGFVGHVLERLLVQFTGPTAAALKGYSAEHPTEEGKVTDLLREIAQRRAADAGGQ